jgi:hypothetical protein
MSGLPKLMNSLINGEWQKSLAKGIPSLSEAPVAPFHQVKWLDTSHLPKIKSGLAQRMIKALGVCKPVRNCPEWPTFPYDLWKQPRGQCGGVIAVKLPGNGMGSDLHTWSEGLCIAMMFNASLHTMSGWVWEAESLCEGESMETQYSHLDSSFGCYFGNQVEARCDRAVAVQDSLLTDTNGAFSQYGAFTYYGHCQLYDYKNESQRVQWRAASMEALFSHINPKVPHMASRLLHEIFGPQGAPDDLIAIHIRHGDKKSEMKLLRIEQFVDAAADMIKKHSIKNPTIFILSDNKEAISGFASAAPANWKITYDPTICSNTYTSKWDGSGTAASLSRQFKGTPGLAQLLGLMIALEAKHFLLTMESNWSRLLEELRVNLIEGHCKKGESCTDAMYVGNYAAGP